MENNEKRDLTKGQEIATEIIGEVAGVGAGGLVGGICLAAAMASPVGKFWKVIYAIGSVGVCWTVQDKVADGTKKAIGDIFEGTNALGRIFNGTRPEVKEPENTTELIEAK